MYMGKDGKNPVQVAGIITFLDVLPPVTRLSECQFTKDNHHRPRLPHEAFVASLLDDTSQWTDFQSTVLARARGVLHLVLYPSRQSQILVTMLTKSDNRPWLLSDYRLQYTTATTQDFIPGWLQLSLLVTSAAAGTVPHVLVQASLSITLNRTYFWGPPKNHEGGVHFFSSSGNHN